MLFAAVAALMCNGALAENYPSQPIKIIVPSVAGAGTDLAMRIVAEPLSASLGQPIVILNRPGSGGGIAARAAHAAPPDGYTLFLAIGSTFTILPKLQQDLAPLVGTFIPISFIGEQPFAIGVRPASGINSLVELVANSKADSFEFNCAVGMRWGLQHLTAEAFREASGAKLAMIYYSGSPQAIQDVIGGQVPVTVSPLSNLGASVEAGLIRLLAVAARSRLPDYPNVPTVAETIPGFYSSGWFVLVAPHGTPDDVVKLVHRHLQKILSSPDTKNRLQRYHTYSRAMTRRELSEFILSEKQQWNNVIKEVKAHAGMQ